MFILKESVRYRLIVPFTLEGEPMAPADAMAGLHTEVFQSLKIPCVQDRGYMFLEIGEKSVLEAKYKTLVAKGALPKNVKGYFDVCSEDFYDCHADLAPASPKQSEIEEELFDSYSSFGDEYENYDFELLEQVAFTKAMAKNWMIAGWKIEVEGKDDPFSKYIKLVALSEEKFSTPSIDLNWFFNKVKPNFTPRQIQEFMYKTYPKAYAYSEMYLSTKDYM